MCVFFVVSCVGFIIILSSLHDVPYACVFV